MIRVNASLPEELYHAAKAADLNVSQILQEALTRALAAESNRKLFDSIIYPAQLVTHDEVISAISDERNDGEA
jgi:post-segregation antitoxin (ccd killing protein)